MSAYYNEIDPYCCRVLRKNIAAGHLPPGDVDERDIRDVQPVDLAGYGHIHLFAGIGGLALACRRADLADDTSICTGGFPCQDISSAGKRAGIEGERSGLWREMVRLLGAVRPRYILVENSAALLERGMGQVLAPLATLGYDARWDCIPASAVGAPHLRDRVFILAYRPAALTARPSEQRRILADTARGGQWADRDNAPRPTQPHEQPHSLRSGSALANADRQGLAIGEGDATPPWPCPAISRSSWWDVEPQVGRVADGVPHRVDRLRGLGNAVVPQCAAIALRVVAQMEIETEQSFEEES